MANRKVHLLHVVVVPRALPLEAVLTRETEQADSLLNEAMKAAELCEPEKLFAEGYEINEVAGMLKLSVGKLRG